MIDLANSVITGTGIMAGAGLLAGHAWRSRRLATRFDAFTRRLHDVETLMYTHQEPEEQRPASAPDFTLPGRAGTPVALDRLRALGKPVLLVFTDPAGETGRSLLATIGSWQDAHDRPVTAVAIGPAPSVDVLPLDVPEGITDLLVDADRRVAVEYGVALTPAVVLIRPNGAIAGTPTVGVRGIGTLLASLSEAVADAARLRAERIESGAPEIGSRAPHLLVPDLDEVDRPVVTGASPQVLLFWSPDCGYCTQLVPELHALEAAPPPGLPPITLVARGSEASNRAQGFRFRTLLDHDLAASTAFGATGTPAAIVVDADGIVVSPVARGIRGVRDLLGLDGNAAAQDSPTSR